MKTMICVLLDRSGSMAGQESDVVGGVNTFIEEQKKLPDPATIALVRFDSEGVERFRAMENLADAKPITAADFQPRGSTPLLDAIGKTIGDLDADWVREQPDRCVMVIVTDGQENYSREFNLAKVKELIKARQDSGKWAIIYLGADVDAFSEAGGLGIPMANSAGYTKTAAGNKAMYSTLSASVGVMRATGATVAHNLAKNIGEDDPSTPAKTGPWTPPA